MVEEQAKQKTVFDSDRQYLGDVYAKALLSLGQDPDEMGGLIDELESFASVLNAIPKLRATLESPRISFADKEKILDRAIKGKASQKFLNFLKVVCGNGRFDCLSAMTASSKQMFDEMSGRVVATMTTAEAVDHNVQSKVAARLSAVLNKQVSIVAEVDPDIIGGLVVRVGDTVYDGSLRNQLKQVRSAAIGRANQEIREALDRFAIEV